MQEDFHSLPDLAGCLTDGEFKISGLCLRGNCQGGLADCIHNPGFWPMMIFGGIKYDAGNWLWQDRQQPLMMLEALAGLLINVDKSGYNG